MAEALRIGMAGPGHRRRVGRARARRKAAELTRQCGRELVVTGVSRARPQPRPRRRSRRGAHGSTIRSTLAETPDIDVFVELIGGDGGRGSRLRQGGAARPAATSSPPTRRCWRKHGVALAEIAEDKGVLLNYEAAVAGGIPVIKTMREAMAGNTVSRVFGILNGTCNYILTRMEAEGLSLRRLPEGRAAARLCRSRSDLRHRGPRHRAQARRS